MNRNSGAFAIAASLAVAWAAGGAAAAESKVTVVKAPDALSQMRVVRDKETGNLRPATSDEIVEMSQAAAPGYAPNVVVVSRPQTTVVTRPDGSATIRRSLDDLDSVVAARTADGRLSLQHGGKAAAPAAKPKE